MEKFASPVGFFKGGGAGGGGSVSLLLIYKKKKIQLKFPQIILRRFGPHDVPCDVIGTRVRPKPSSSHVSSSERSHLPKPASLRKTTPCVRDSAKFTSFPTRKKKNNTTLRRKFLGKEKTRQQNSYFSPTFPSTVSAPRCDVYSTRFSNVNCSVHSVRENKPRAI